MTLLLSFALRRIGPQQGAEPNLLKVVITGEGVVFVQRCHPWLSYNSKVGFISPSANPSERWKLV